MYYAYSISLMYFLRKKSDKSCATRLFNLLQLDEEQQSQLHYLLENERHQAFTIQHLKKIIEPILGPATRRFAAEKTKAEYLFKPQASALFSAAVYGMEYFFKLTSTEKSPALAQVLETTQFNNPNYTHAEIYAVRNMQKYMKQFVNEKQQLIRDEFTNRWFKWSLNIQQNTTKTLLEIEQDVFYRKQLLQDIIAQYTVEFFAIENAKYLDLYIKHLNSDFRWGTDETLYILHRNLQQENAYDDEGNVKAIPDYVTNMRLQIYKEGVLVSGQVDETPDIILNNLFNTHWTSLVDINVPISDELSGQKNHELDICGFNSCMNLLQYKARDLKMRNALKASDEAFDLFNKLVAIKLNYLELDSMNSQKFSEECRILFDNAPQDELRKHRGFKRINNLILKVLIIIVSGISPALKKYRVIDPLQTESIARISSLKNSLNKVDAHCAFFFKDTGPSSMESENSDEKKLNL